MDQFNFIKSWEVISSETQAAVIGGLIAFIGIIMGVILTKISEFVQIENRREKRASWPAYQPRSMYVYKSHSSFNPNDLSRKFFDIRINFSELEVIGAKCVKLIPGLRVKNSEVQLEELEGVNLEIYTKMEAKRFFFKTSYIYNGFYYKDCWIGELINARGSADRPSFQIKYIGPLNYWGYITNIAKEIFRGEKSS